MDKFIVIVMLSLLSSVMTEETYENSSRICERCKCDDKIDTFLLDCTNQSIHHSLANWPPHNKTLIAIFSYNDIPTLEKLPDTEQKVKLTLDHCNIRYLDVRVFSQMKNLEFLDLSYNLLKTEEIDGEDFKGAYSNDKYYEMHLKYLNLAYNELHALPKKFFENMPYLEELNLEGNDFTVLSPSTQLAIASLTNLKVLNLANNELTEIEEDVLKTLVNLEEIDLSSNHLEFVPETLSYVSKSLKILNLSNNKMFEFDDKSFLGLDLTELYLDDLPGLKYVKPNAFSVMKNLKKFSMCNNQNLTSIDKDAFDRNQTLDEFYLNNNSISIIKYYMLNWSSLKVFQMEENPLECTCDLFNISKNLQPSITRNKDGPECIDLHDGNAKSIYSLSEDLCKYNNQPFNIYHAAARFKMIRSIIITLSLVLLTGFVIAMVVAFLRYRRGVAFRNYPFTAQVSYYPVRVN